MEVGNGVSERGDIEANSMVRVEGESKDIWELEAFVGAEIRIPKKEVGSRDANHDVLGILRKYRGKGSDSGVDLKGRY